jgi:hypothetical protein
LRGPQRPRFEEEAAIRALGKLLVQLSGALIVWAPLLTLTLLGGAYLLQVYETVTASGGPMVLHLESRGGMTTIRAENYALDPLRGSIHATEVSVWDPSGIQTAQAQRVIVRLPNYFGRGPRLVRARIVGLQATIERDAEGRFTILDLVPKEREPEAETPFSVEIDGAAFVLQDRLVPEGIWARRLMSPRIWLDGVGGDWRAAGHILDEAGGAASVIVRNDPESGLALEGSLARMDLAPWLAPLRRTEAARNWELLQGFFAERLVATGPVFLHLPNEGKAALRASLAAEATRVRHQDLAADRARLRATFDLAGLTGWIEADRGRSRARFAGRVAWEPGVRVFGNVEADLQDRGVIPAQFRKELPPELDFRQAGFRGVVRYVPKEGLAAHGRVQAQRATWQDEMVEEPRFWVHWDAARLAVREFAGIYEGVPVSGGADADLRRETLLAYASTGAFPLERFLAEPQRDRLRGSARLFALATGSMERPQVELRAMGRAAAEIEPGRFTDLGPFQALAHYREPRVEIERLTLAGPAGLAVASGAYDIQAERLTLQGLASGLDLSLLRQGLSGTAAGRFELVYDEGRLLASGPVEVYGLEIEGESVPLVSANVQLAGQELIAREVIATRGAGRVAGEARWNLETDAISGAFSAETVSLQDLLGEGFEGTLALTRGTLDGTLKNPRIEAWIQGRDLVLQGVRVDSAQGLLSLVGREAFVRQALLSADQGTLSLQADYHLDTKTGRASGTAQDLPMERLHPLLPPDTGVEGLISGDFRAFFADSELTSFDGSGNVDALSVNRAFLGNGFFTVGTSDGIWTGTAELGQPERFLQIPEFVYRSESQDLAAQVVAYGLPVRDLYFALRPYAEADPGEPAPAFELPENLREILDRLEGSLDLSATISGAIENPNLRIESLLLRNTRVDGEPTGQISAVVNRDAGTWQIQSLEWTGGPGIFDVRGTVAEKGAIALDGNINNFDTQWLGRFVPAFQRIAGEASVFFTVSGPTESPIIEASLSGSIFEDPSMRARLAALAPEERAREEEKLKDLQLKLEIYPILVQEGQISLDGNFTYRGFTGTLEGTIPFRYPLSFSEDQSLALALHVPNRPLDELKPLLPRLDEARTEGSVSAEVRLTGSVAEATLSGGVQLEAASLAFEGVDTVLTNLKGATELSGQAVTLTLSAESAKGGRFSSTARLDLGGVPNLLEATQEQLMAAPLTGSLNLDALRFAERSLPLDTVQQSFLSAEATATGEILLEGPLAEPSLRTAEPLKLEKVKGDVPAIFPASTGGAEPLVNPRLEIRYVLGSRDEPAQIEASASQLNLYGAGSLSGSLLNLEANADLAVRSGSIRLPNARINVLEGGSVRLVYDAQFGVPDFRLDVDLEGRTTLSTIRFGTLVERYDIYLEIRGNLLDPEQQILTARSDPPDLSQDRILSLLGQIELVERISGQFLGRREWAELQQALAQVAFPYLFDPLTEDLARQLGLEYLSFDYGPLGQTNVTAAKWLGKGFLLQGRREISEPVDGIRDFDIRLTYRPPRRLRSLRNFLFSIGLDQDRPWKISVEYGARLPNSGSRHKSNIIYIGDAPPQKKPDPPADPPPDLPIFPPKDAPKSSGSVHSGDVR